MPSKKDKPAVKKTGATGIKSEQGQSGQPSENVIELNKASTAGHDVTSSPAESQTPGSPAGDGGHGSKLFDGGSGQADQQQTGSVLPGSAGNEQQFGQSAGDALAGDKPGFAWLSATEVRALEVTAHRDGYRRAGREWSKAPVTVRLSELSDEQVHQLVGDANLHVRPTYVPAVMEGEEL